MEQGKINCPNCGKVFAIEDAGYADILKQVRDSEFEQQLHKRLELAEKDKRNAVELAKEKVGGVAGVIAGVREFRNRFFPRAPSCRKRTKVTESSDGCSGR